LKPIEVGMPKLRETGSTFCGSPKAEVAKVALAKIAEFKKLKILGKGRFGAVYLVKYVSLYSGTPKLDFFSLSK
jgi:hypothetical protein